MSRRTSRGRDGGLGGLVSEDDLDVIQQDEMDEDDNAMFENSDEEDELMVDGRRADPLTISIIDLEERCVQALDSFKLHDGKASAPTERKIHEELSGILRPVLEIAAHVGPNIARTHSRYRNSVDESVEEIYQRINQDIVLPELLEVAQSDIIPAKRAASLSFFYQLYKECQQAGSYLDKTASIGGGGGQGSSNQQMMMALNAGPTGPGYVGGVNNASALLGGNKNAAANRMLLKRRNLRKQAREGELLRYWVESSNGCLVEGTFTSEQSDGSTASRGVLAASASIRPCLRYISSQIAQADDASATRLYLPTIKMMEGVMHRLFKSISSKKLSLSSSSSHQGQVDSLISTCIKFLETVTLCFSSKEQQGVTSSSSLRRRAQNTEDFALEDLPTGHPVITREALEEVGEFAFHCLRGLTLVGGQVKIDTNLLLELIGVSTNSSTQELISILKPAALAFLEIESTLMVSLDVSPSSGEAKDDEEEEELENKKKILDRTRGNLELDFALSQKSYSVTINALSIVATNRPTYYEKACECLSQRTMDPPKFDSENMEAASSTSLLNHLAKNSVMAITSHLKASCLTLLRNPMSVTLGPHIYLKKALVFHKMELQASKAYRAAKQQADLRTAGRAARNRAATYYQWDQADSSKRKRQIFDKDDALSKLRKAKMARGLGNGIQLPTSMVDMCELILLNLEHLPETNIFTDGTKTKTNDQKHNKEAMTSAPTITLDYVVDAIMSNGASLSNDVSHWYERDGGAAWNMIMDSTSSVDGQRSPVDLKLHSQTFPTIPPAETISSKSSNKQKQANPSQMYYDQCRKASSEAFTRILTAASNSRSKSIAQMGLKISARLAWTLKNVQPSSKLQDTFNLAKESVQHTNKILEEDKDLARKDNLTDEFVDEFPLVSTCLALDVADSSDVLLLDSKKKNSTAAEAQQAMESASSKNTTSTQAQTLTNYILDEAKAKQNDDQENDDEMDLDQDNRNSSYERYKSSLNLYASNVVYASERAKDKPNDVERKRVATQSAQSLNPQFILSKQVTPLSLRLTAALCDIEQFYHRAAEAQRKNSQHSLSASAAAHASKKAAEKRATSALLTLRDVAYMKTDKKTEREFGGSAKECAVECAVAIASGRFKTTPDIEDKALKLIINHLYSKSPELANIVVESATKELERAAQYSIEKYNEVMTLSATKDTAKTKSHHSFRENLLPKSDLEKQVLEKVKKSALLFIAICVRQPTIIQTLFEISSQSKADVLSKAVRQNMPKFAKAVAKKYGVASITLAISNMATSLEEDVMLLSFLDNLSHRSDANPPTQELIDVCLQIQQNKMAMHGGKKMARYLVPVLSGMRRSELVKRLPEFILSGNTTSGVNTANNNVVYKMALERMSERLGRHVLNFRDEPVAVDSNGKDSNASSQQTTQPLVGMTLCEQLVFLLRLDFSSVGMTQKQYLHSIEVCLNEEEMFTDRVLMAALDYISVKFSEGANNLPLAYMRITMLTCAKHESLHSWICHVLLPRLVQARIYAAGRREWEGWMRCARMLENSPDGGISSIQAIQQLPSEQLRKYREKYPDPGMSNVL